MAAQHGIQNRIIYVHGYVKNRQVGPGRQEKSRPVAIPSVPYQKSMRKLA